LASLLGEPQQHAAAAKIASDSDPDIQVLHSS